MIAVGNNQDLVDGDMDGLVFIPLARITPCAVLSTTDFYAPPFPFDSTYFGPYRTQYDSVQDLR